MAHPALCGLARQHLGEFIEELAPRWEARCESGRHERRRGRRRRQAGAGPKYELVFTDRVLVTLVHLRTGLTHDALAVIYQVGSSTVGRAIAEIRPLLAGRGFAVPTGLACLPLEDRVLLLAAYWRTNLTLRQLAPSFGVSKSAADRIIDHLGPSFAGAGSPPDAAGRTGRGQSSEGVTCTTTWWPSPASFRTVIVVPVSGTITLPVGSAGLW